MKSPLISLASRFDLAARALSALLLSALAIGGAFGAEPFVQDSGAAGLISIEVENHDASYPYSQLVIFGDSMSDTGNLFGLTGGALPSDPPYAQGHYSNGQVWPEYAASAMGVPLRNYAYGSALTGYQNLDGPYPGMRTGLDDYVASNSGGVDPNGLYVVWAGANDFFNLSSFSSGAISATIDQAVSNIITAVSQLAALDAQHIVVGTLPDLGLIPYATGGESLGSPAQLSSASAQFNTQLRNALASTGLSPLVLDSYEILNRVVSSGSTYGLTNVSDRCVQASGAVCSSPSDYLFWDDRHPSTEGHRVLAEQFLGLVGGSAAPPHAWTGAFPSGASGGKAMEASPNTNGNIDSGYVASSPQLRYQVDFVNAGVHYVWIRGKGPTSRDDSLHVGLNGAAVSTADRITDFTAAWTWSKDTMDGAVAQINIPSAGVHTINVWMREDGILLDKLVLTRSTSYAPTGAGPAESPRGQAAPVAQTPLITPAGGSYTDSVTVTLSTGNGADTIHYTTNGSTPTAASPVYGGDFALTASATVKAIGLRSGYADSAVASASFTITPATEGGSGSGEYQQAADGLVSIELENHDNTTSASGHSWNTVSRTGASGTAVQSLPNNSTNINSGYASSSPRMDYAVNFTRSGVHYVWIRGQGPSNKDDSLHVGLNGAAVSTADRITNFSAAWTWSKGTMDGAVAQINIPSAGVHTINVWMREDGMIGDKLVLTPSASYTPAGSGPAESSRGQAAPVVQTPVITPAGGTHTESVTVTLSTGSGADTIHYTTDGSTPTAASPVYGGGFTLTGSATVKAVGLRSGYAASAVASASFTVTPVTGGGGGSGEYQQASDGLVSIELENHDNTTSASGHSWNTVSRTGASGTAVQSLPNNSTNINSGYASSSPRMDYAVNFTRSGVHYVWIRGQGPSNKDDSLHVGLNGAAVSTADRITNFSAAWTWSKGTMDGAVAQINIPSAGVHTINVWMREDGMIGDKLVLTPSAGYTPTGAGPAESIRGTAASGSLVFDKTVLEFAVVSGGGNPAVMGVTLRAADGSNVPVTLSTSDSWLSVTPASGSTPVGTASVSVDPSSLAAGVYSASVTASATGFNAATLDVVVTASPSLPFEQDFSGGGTADWTVVESSGDASNWRISGGAYQQLNTTSRTVHGPDIYVDGSFSYLNTGLGLADYRFSVDVTSTANDPEQIGSDLGILFRVQDKENYYRFALNSKFGYSELVKRKAEVGKPGVYSTLAVDSRGYRPGKTLRLGVEVVGPTMRVYVAEAGTVASVFDTDPLFAARDSDHTSGSIALYTQAKARFDNLRVDPPTSAARIGIAKAVSFGVETGAAVPVGAVVSNMPSGGRVEFSIDGAACGSVSQTAPGYFQSSCSAPSQGEHELVARLLNSSGGELDRDTNLPVGSEGEALLVIGDSISNGVGDRYGTDNISRDIALNGAQVGPRMISIRGYDTPLHDLLTASTLWTAPNGIANAGVPGDRSDQALDRIGSVLARHPGANRALFLLGTNDVLSSISPSPGAFKDILQDLIDQSEAAGVAPMFAKIPPIFGVFKGTVYTNPASRSHNVLVRQYNAVIDELNDENLLKPGPDLYSALMPASGPLISLSRDNLHPNALGHSMMARLWFNALTGANTQPFVLRDLCLRLNSASCEYPGSYTDPVYYQQTLLELGSPYSVDLGSTLTRIPTQLEGGIWVTTATAHRTNTRADYLSFTVDRAVEVYVAYDGAASTLPTWLRGFSATGETVGVSGAAGTLDVYRRSYVADSNVTLGGASADGKSGTISENYLVVVQEQ